MKAELVEGNLIEQKVDVIVNAWNRNIIPWWLLLPQGVSGAIKKSAGIKPFTKIGKFGAISLGNAVLTSAGKLPFKAIIHVAGINMFWRASKFSIRKSTMNAIDLAEKHKFSSIAFPIIGAGSGGFTQAKSLEIMLDQVEKLEADLIVKIVKYKK